MIHCIYASAALAVIYTLLSVCFERSAAVLAFPVSAAFTFIYIFVFARLKKRGEWKAFRVFRKMTEYAPFVYFAVFVLRRCGPATLLSLLTSLQRSFGLRSQFFLLYCSSFFQKSGWQSTSPPSRRLQKKESQSQRRPLSGLTRLCRRRASFF